MSGRVSQAVHAFRQVELAELLLDKRKVELRVWMNGLTEEEMKEYLRQTNDIIQEFAEKREKAGL